MDDIFAYGMADLLRERLAIEALAGHRQLFLGWAAYYGYKRNRQWCVGDPLSEDDLLAVIRKLRDDQLDELSYRGLIGWHFPTDNDELLLEELERVYLGPNGASIVYDPLTLATRYRLSVGTINLLPGDLEVLAGRGFPSNPDQFIRVFWQRIAPSEPREHRFVTLCKRRAHQ
jgi:hypothetical protein